MSGQSHEHLKMIRFEDELLPHWASLLNLAARLSPVPAPVCDWFSRFTACSGVDDARTVIARCEELRAGLEGRADAVAVELQRSRNDAQPSQIISAWIYALDTMIQTAAPRKTCSWRIVGTGEDVIDGSDGGDITLRRV